MNKEFIFLIDSYYQGFGWRKGETLLPEIHRLREILSQHPKVAKAFADSDSNYHNQSFALVFIKSRIDETYNLNAAFLKLLEDSVTLYQNKLGGDIISYRIAFQTYRDNLCTLVGTTLPHIDPNINRKVAIENIVDSILKEDYWAEDVIQQIRLVRAFETTLGLSDNWIKHYAKAIFTK